MSALEDAARRWYETRVKHRATKAALREYRQERGGCADPDPENGPCNAYGGLYSRPWIGWCEPCRGAQPLWVAYRAAAKAAGMAVQALSRACLKEA